MEQLEKAIFGNGQPGLLKSFERFFARWEEREAERARADVERQKEQDRREKKFNRIVAIIGVILSALGVCAVLLTLYWKSLEAHHVVLNTPTSVTASKVESSIPPVMR